MLFGKISHRFLRPFEPAVLREGFESTMEKQSIVIASRESALAMWQAKHVQSLLQRRYPTCDVSILSITTRGDKILDKKLSLVGGKGLFVKELEAAMQEGRADLAVHSLKDVPMQLPEGFSLACVTVREDSRDACQFPICLFRSDARGLCCRNIKPATRIDAQKPVSAPCRSVRAR